MDYLNFNLAELTRGPDARRRFDLARFIVMRNDCLDVANSAMLEQLMDLTSVGTYLISDDAGRADMVSYNVYGDTQYWWLLLTYNNLIRNEELRAGMTINLFSLDDLSNLFFSLSRSQIEINRDNAT